MRCFQKEKAKESPKGNSPAYFGLVGAFFNRHYSVGRIDCLSGDSPTVSCFAPTMPLLRSFQILLAFGLFLCAASPAQAAFLFCNHTQWVIEAAFGSREGSTWTSEGWWQIQPGQCARVSNKPLTQRFYFYHARALTVSPKDERKKTVWSGKYAFCTDNKAFRIEGDSNCEARGYRQQGFQEVDVGLRQRDYTLTFRDNNGR